MAEEKEQRRKVTVRDVAALAGVSEATVSRVFNNHTGIRQEHRQAVLDAAEQLGYSPRKRAEPTAINNIAFCLRKLNDEASQNPYFSHILHGAQAECARREISMTLWMVDPEVTTINDMRRMLRQGPVDALLLVNLLDGQLVRAIGELELPIVLIEDYFPWLPYDGVISDGFNGMSLAMQHLIDSGHCRIAMIDGPQNHYQARLRYMAYRLKLDEAGIAFDPDLVVQGDLLMEGGMNAMNQLLQSGKEFTAVVCSNDSTAFGAMRALNDSGIRVPHDISIVGHDNVEAAAIVSPPLSTVRARTYDIGQQAVARLFERVSNPDAVPTLILTQEEFIPRQSVRKV
jgi:DNA-binding LacI/PurR family transcriptional regulator